MKPETFKDALDGSVSVLSSSRFTNTEIFFDSVKHLTEYAISTEE
jgi:hypothetical protein